MKIADLTEYNKGIVGNPVDLTMLQKLQNSGEFLTKFNRDNNPVNIYKTVDYNSVWFILEFNHEIIGYIRAEELPDTNILQVKDEQIFHKFRNKGIGTEMYITLAKIGGFRFINDIQLSDSSENMWKNKLLTNHIIKGIYDRNLDKVYPIASVGQYTDDKQIILSPENDTSDPFIDYDGSTQRFFWIIESNNCSVANVELLEAHNAFYKHGHNLLYINQLQYNRARMTPKLLSENIGF